MLARRETPAASDGCRRRRAEPSMVVTAWPSARNAGIRQLCTGSPSISTVQAPQSPASQPFLTPKLPSSRRKRAQALPGRGFRESLPLISKLMAAPEFGADLLRKPQRHVLAPGRFAVNVVVIERFGDCCRMAWRSSPAPAFLATTVYRPDGRGRDGQRKTAFAPMRRSAAPPSGRPASAKSGETPSAASRLRAEYRSGAADRRATARSADCR